MRAAGSLVRVVPPCVQGVTEAGALAFKLDELADVVLRLRVHEVVDGLPSSCGVRRCPFDVAASPVHQPLGFPVMVAEVVD